MNVKEGFDAAKTALDSELHQGAAQRYERRGDPARAQTERLQAAAARPEHRRRSRAASR